jgi:tRNA (guanine37-N1)-methyltransferase
MRIDILTVVPQLLEGPFSHSILKRAQEKGLAEIHVHNIRDFSLQKQKQVDDYQYGGGAGMVMCIEPIVRAIDHLKEQREYAEIIFMTPDGEVLDQNIANQLSLSGNLIILCGHYKGIDERIREHYITREISIGSYVLSGGELAAAVLVDSIVRLIPGVLNDETSALTDSFQDNLLSPPVYTRPEEFNGWKVPEVLLSGNPALVDKWREEQALKRTKERRPDLLSSEE